MLPVVTKHQHQHAEPGLMAELFSTAHVFTIMLTMSLSCPYHALTMS